MKNLSSHIGGEWVRSASPERRVVKNPATGEDLADLPVGAEADVDHAVAAAAGAQGDWYALGAAQRIDLLEEFADAISGAVDELADLESLEMGKPVNMAREFINWAAQGFRDKIAQARKYPFEQLVASDRTGVTKVVRHPHGVAAVVVPWNFTIASILTAAGPLLSVGNTVVVKPSERASVSAVRLGELLPLPPGVMNILLGDGSVGAPLVRHEDVSYVRFTGSVAAGKSVAVGAANHLCGATLELGGKDPAVVDEDIDPVATAADVARGAYLNSGQICTSIERVYVHERVANEFIDALVAETGDLVMGDPRDPHTTLGPLVDQAQRRVVHEHVADAVGRGASLLTGGIGSRRPGSFYPPTVLVGVDGGMRIMREETFGPVAPVQVVSSFEEAVRCASDSRYGLAATVYSNRPENIEAAQAIPTALLWVNRWQGGGTDQVYEPARDSGLGIAGGAVALDAATRPSVVFHAADPH